MKKLVLAGLVAVSVLVGNVFGGIKEYPMAHVCRTAPHISITKVELTNDETIVYMKYEPTGKEMGIYPPGHDMAFFITDVSNAKKYNLLDAEDIAIKPNLQYADREINFKLIFERIPDSMKRFHIIEGKLPTETSITWHFTNVKLK
jgi:hypothetical protein